MTSARGSFTLSWVTAVNDTHSVTGLGFTPDFIMFMWDGSGDTLDHLDSDDFGAGIGFSAGASDNIAAGVGIEDDNNVYGTQQAIATDCCIMPMRHLGANTVEARIDVQSMDADGFTLECVEFQANPEDMHIQWVAFYGYGNVATGTFSESGSTGTQGYTGVGFQPDALFILGTRNNALNDDGQGGSAIALGAAIGTAAAEQAVTSFYTNGDSDASTYCLDGEVLALNSGGNAVVARASLDSFDADGFTLDWLEAGGHGREFVYLAVEGGSWAFGSLLTQTTLNNTVAETGFGFQPETVIFSSGGQAESTTNAADDANGANMTTGVALSSSDRASVWFGAGESGNRVAQGMYESACIIVGDPADAKFVPAIHGIMDLDSIDSDGFTVIQDDADDTQNFVWWIATTAVADVTVTPSPASAIAATPAVSGILHTLSPAAASAIAASKLGALTQAITPAVANAVASGKIGLAEIQKHVVMTFRERKTLLTFGERDTELTFKDRKTLLTFGDRHDG